MAFLLVVLLPLGGTAFYGNWVTSHVLEEVALNSTRHQLELLSTNISSDLTGLGNETLYLSRLDSLADLLVSRSQGDVAAAAEVEERLIQDFLVYAQNHPLTDQIRYLDEKGQEVVRIDCIAGDCRPRPDSELQNKADRYYFTETMQLSAGQLYVSPLDLNQEFGQIERPHRPVIRLAAPVFFPNTPPGSEKSRAGMVIINVLAESILAAIYQAGVDPQVVALADTAGFYLAHPDEQQRWGGPSNLNTGAGMARDYGSLWPAFFEANEAAFYYPVVAGWQQLAAELLPPEPFIAAQRAIVFQRMAPFDPTGPTWLLVSNQPRVALIAPVAQFRWTAIAILGLAALVALGMTISLARRLTGPIATLTQGARRIERGEWDHRIQVNSRDEIGELAVAFNAMAVTQQRYLEQLSALHQASRHIAARLEQSQVLEATLYAVQRMFPVAYTHISLNYGNALEPFAQAEAGDATWATHHQLIEHQSILRAALRDFEWRVGTLLPGAGPPGFFCVAPLCGGKEFLGLLEIYGADPALATPATSNVLAALAAQVSIALENAWLYRQLAEHRAQLQDLVEQLISAQEEERRMLAYDIHDGLIQRLVGARLYLTNWADEHANEEDETLTKGLTQLGAAISEARAIIEGLRPVLLDDLGLVEALRQHVYQVAAEAHWQVTFSATPETMQAPDVVEITAFRITQEALTNVRKHAQASWVSVMLALQDGFLSIEIRDSGCGFDQESMLGQPRRVGLTSMRERARLVGGQFSLNSAPGAGTTVQVLLPVNGLVEPVLFSPPGEEAQ